MCMHVAGGGSLSTVGMYIKICSILLHYPFKFKSRSCCPCMNPLVKEQASSRYELIEREGPLYICAQSLCETQSCIVFTLAKTS